MENYDDISVFTEEELSQLRGKLFETQFNEYTRIKKLQTDIQQLKLTKDIKVEQLPVDVFKKYEELCLNHIITNNITCG